MFQMRHTPNPDVKMTKRMLLIVILAKFVALTLNPYFDAKDCILVSFFVPQPTILIFPKFVFTE